MEKLQIARNSILALVIRVLDTAFSVIIWLLLARHFGRSGFGKLSFLSVFFFLMAVVESQWIKPILTREISRDDTNAGRILGNGLMIRLLVSLASIALFWAVILWVRPESEVLKLALPASLGLMIASVTLSYEIVFRVAMKMKYLLAAGIVSRLATLVIVGIAFWLKISLFDFLMLSLVPLLLLFLLTRHYAEKIIRPRFNPDFSLWRKIFHDSWPLALSACFIFIYHRIDQVMLFRIAGPGPTGIYAAAARLSEVLNIVPVAVMSIALPAMSRAWLQSAADHRRIYSTGFRYMLVFIIPVAFASAIFSPKLIALFYDSGFLPAAPVLNILIWAEIFVFCGMVNSAVLISANKQKIEPLLTGASALANIVLNAILIPHYGSIGAGVASLISYAVGPVLGGFLRSTREYSLCMLRHSLRPALASAVMLSVYYHIRMPIPAALLVLPSVYFLVLYLIRGIGKADLALAFQAGGFSLSRPGR